MTKTPKCQLGIRPRLVAKHRQGGEIHLVGAVCVCRVYGWLNVRGIVVQHIEDVMTFMIIRANNADVNWRMVCHNFKALVTFSCLMLGSPPVRPLDLALYNPSLVLSLIRSLSNCDKPAMIVNMSFPCAVPVSNQLSLRLFKLMPLFPKSSTKEIKSLVLRLILVRSLTTISSPILPDLC